jgi:DNA repair protein SbcD/Mre11
MKALHAADIHLDSPLRGLSMYEDAPTAELRSATRRAFDGLVDLAIEDEVGLVLLAGDVFDGDWPHYATGAHFVRQMLRLQEAGIAVVAIAGNHDAESKLTKSLRLPGNVTMLSTRRPQTWTNEELGVAVHGQGYATPAVLEDLCRAYPAPVPGLINIGLLHTSADGRPGHERYAPCYRWQQRRGRPAQAQRGQPLQSRRDRAARRPHSSSARRDEPRDLCELLSRRSRHARQRR